MNLTIYFHVLFFQDTNRNYIVPDNCSKPSIFTLIKVMPESNLYKLKGACYFDSGIHKHLKAHVASLTSMSVVFVIVSFLFLFVYVLLLLCFVSFLVVFLQIFYSLCIFVETKDQHS